jgi:hypothetical protein
VGFLFGFRVISGRRAAHGGGRLRKLFQKFIPNPVFLVILNEVKDLEPLDNPRFFASLRMTVLVELRFCNDFKAHALVTPIGMGPLTIVDMLREP